MTEVILYVSGDKIASIAGVRDTGNANNQPGDDKIVFVDGVKTLGTAKDCFKIVVTQADGRDSFSNGIKVSIHDAKGNLLAKDLNPQDDMFGGRASGSDYGFMFGNGASYLIDLKGLNDGARTYGPAFTENTGTRLPFTALSTAPTNAADDACFTPGTLIRTPDGLRAVETLAVGDLVMTRDNGAQPIVWCGRTTRDGTGRHAPILIDTGVFGNVRPMRVSPQHRMVVSGPAAQLFFGEPEVLAAAVHLVNGTTVRVAPQPQVTYLHIACQGHEIIEADGAATETMFFGDSILGRMDTALHAELTDLFPEVRTMHAATARRCLRGYEARLVA